MDNSENAIDSRDVIARIDELTSELEALTGAVTEAETDDDRLAAAEHLEAWHADNGDELKALTVLQAEAEGYAADWRHGEILIRDSYFEDYARQLAEDIGAINSDAKWPNNCIDWEKAAEQLQQDYTSVDFDGVTYWVRS